MQSYSLIEILNQKKLQKDAALLKEKLIKHPYSQNYNLLLSEGFTPEAPHRIYDWSVNEGQLNYKAPKDAVELDYVKFKNKKSAQPEADGEATIAKKKSKSQVQKSLKSKKKKKKDEGQKSKKQKEGKKPKKEKKEKKKSKGKKKKVQKKGKPSPKKIKSSSRWNALSGKSEVELKAYTKWINKLYPQASEPLKSEKKKKAKSKKRNPIQDKIHSSLQVKDSILSENLAKLYFDQAHYAEALDMYERLSLKNPEKSHFFAPLIEEIKSKLK